MVLTSNKELLEHVFSSLITITGRISSGSYAIIVLKSILDNVGKKYSFSSFITIRTSDFSSSQETIIINGAINTIDPMEIGKFIQDTITELLKPFGNSESARSQLLLEIKGYLGHGYLLKLNNIGVLL
jgi:hypothetical protein